MNRPSVEQLKVFRPLDSLSANQLILAAANAEIKRFDAGVTVFEINSHDRFEYFLLKGSVELESFDARFKTIEASSESARTAIALLQPRKYTVRTKQTCEFILIQQSVIEALLRELPDLSEANFTVSSIQSGHEVADILESFKYDLEHNTLSLPSIPDVAFRIRDLLESDDVSAKDITKVLQNDPAITVKLIRACNSPLYKSVNEINSAHDAVVRLGFNTTKQLVTVFAMNEVFKSRNQFLKKKMQHIWEHARELAAVSHVLGKLTPGLDPELSLLAGLIKDIGVIPLLNYIEDYPQFMSDDEKVDSLLNELKSSVGGILLRHWAFQQDLIDVAEQSHQWQHVSDSDKPSYVDLAIVAEIHTLLGKNHSQDTGGQELPHFSDIPAFKKLGDHGLTIEQSQKVVHESHQQIRDLQNFLGAS